MTTKPMHTFPVVTFEQISLGMTLRDYFAGRVVRQVQARRDGVGWAGCAARVVRPRGVEPLCRMRN
jgi:hypothetical protein